MRTSTLFKAKKIGLFEIYGMSARTREEGLSQCGQEGSSRFCGTSFMDGPLTKNRT